MEDITKRIQRDVLDQDILSLSRKVGSFSLLIYVVIEGQQVVISLPANK